MVGRVHTHRAKCLTVYIGTLKLEEEHMIDEKNNIIMCIDQLAYGGHSGVRESMATDDKLGTKDFSRWR